MSILPLFRAPGPLTPGVSRRRLFIKHARGGLDDPRSSTARCEMPIELARMAQFALRAARTCGSRSNGFYGSRATSVGHATRETHWVVILYSDYFDTWAMVRWRTASARSCEGRISELESVVRRKGGSQRDKDVYAIEPTIRRDHGRVEAVRGDEVMVEA